MPICSEYKKAALGGIIGKDISPRDMYLQFHNQNVQLLIQCDKRDCPHWNHSLQICEK